MKTVSSFAPRLNLLTALTFFVLLGACSSKSTTRPLTQIEQFNALQDGKSTTQDVQIIFGVPDVSLTNGKTKTWVYRDKKHAKKPIYQIENGQLQGLILVFDDEGVLKNHSSVNVDSVKTAQKKDDLTPIIKSK